MAKSGKRKIEQYEHKGKKRTNNPPVGLVTPATDKDAGKKKYAYDPHLDPSLQWAGKAEHTSFEVPTVSLHVHERIDPRTILEAVRRPNGAGAFLQGSLFDQATENLPLRQALDFYKHPHGWSNRLVAGDSLLVMNSLLEKEGLAGKVQMVYIDPPYGIKYGSNFQPFVNKRDVKDRKDEDLTQEPEMIRAFRDTWELGIHSYLTYLRDRLLLARELLHESGSCFVQISDENLHFVRTLMDDVFTSKNFCALVPFRTAISAPSNIAGPICDYLLWYAMDRKKTKFHRLYKAKEAGTEGASVYNQIELPDGTRRRLTVSELSNAAVIEKLNGQLFSTGGLENIGATASGTFDYEFMGKTYHPGANRHWVTTRDGLDRLAKANRIVVSGSAIRYVRFINDFPVVAIENLWNDTLTGSFTDPKVYVVQTNIKTISRCLLMTTDPGDLVFDPTCGSGTTAYVAEQRGRRWITCDTSRVAVTLAKQRLMTAIYDYYQLAHPDEGVGSGFKYKTVPHVTLKSIANNEPPDQETLYDQPLVDTSRLRVTGPFTVEAVPAPAVRPLADPVGQAASLPADASIARTGPTLRQAEWRAELLQSGIRGKHKQRVEFSRVEPLGGTRWLHAEAETKNGKPQRVVISFGPEHAPLEQRQVELAWEEARTLNPKPGLLVFAAFQFDPEAAKDIDELTLEKTGMTFLKAQMNPDLLTDDLKKKRASNESFWLVGQPDVALRQIRKGNDEGKWEVEVYGFDYYNPRKGTIESGDTSNIAMWLLDPDYDGRSLFPRQVFFPMAGDKEGWAKLAKNLKAEIDEDMIEAYRGVVSLPFELGENSRVAVKIIDDRGIESLRVIPVE
ncbi:MAG: site-specific DNA-methyltransferase [Gemmataceae bacterium]|nr:site-specific DNA-methyltransferase [Gemmataceae bacterium]